MKAFNSRKTPKEHWLFIFKRKPIYLTDKYGYSRKFIIYRKNHNFFIKGEYPEVHRHFKEIMKIVTGSTNCISIGKHIKRIEERYSIKIKDTGLSRKDFSCDMKNYKKIADVLKKHIEKTKYVNWEEE